MQSSNILIHHGIKGQRWGLRRYQNYDGSYTQAGLERYRKSSEAYEKRKQEYRDIKRDRTASSYEKRYAKGKMKEAKRRMEKDYRHLAEDKKADEGKILYAQGKRITSNRNNAQLLLKAGTFIAAGAEIARYYGYIDTKTARKAQYAALGATALGEMKLLLDEIPNNKLRAYYSHTSHY